MGMQDRDWYRDAVREREKTDRTRPSRRTVFNLPVLPPSDTPPPRDLPMHPLLLVATVVSICFFVYKLVNLFLK